MKINIMWWLNMMYTWAYMRERERPTNWFMSIWERRERERDPPTGLSRLLVELGRGVNADDSVSFPSSLCSICKRRHLYICHYIIPDENTLLERFLNLLIAACKEAHPINRSNLQVKQAFTAFPLHSRNVHISIYFLIRNHTQVSYQSEPLSPLQRF